MLATLSRFSDICGKLNIVKVNYVSLSIDIAECFQLFLKFSFESEVSAHNIQGVPERVIFGSRPRPCLP